MTKDEFEALVASAMARFEAMTPDEQAAEREAQRRSFVRGQLAMGSDADEARERQRLRDEGKRPPPSFEKRWVFL